MRSNDAVVGCQGISGDSCCSALLASVGNSTSTTTNSSKSSSSNTTIIVACSIVGALLLIVVIIASCVLGSKKRRQQQQQKHQQQQTMMMMNGPNMKQLSPSPALSPFLDEDFSKGVTSSNASFNIVASGPASASSTIVPLPGPANENNNHWTQNSIYYQQPPVPVSSPRANPPPPQQAAPPSPTAKHGQMGQPFPLPKLALPVTPPTANENGITDNTNSSTSESTAVVATPIKETATRVVVIHPYYPTLADELGLEVGCEILLMKLFDDGWGFGVKPMTGQQGAFPLVCVSKGLTNEEIENVKPEEIVTAAVMPQLSSPSSGSPINSSLKQQKVKSILQKPRVVSSVIPQLTEPKFSKRISSQLLSKEQMEKFGINAQRLSQLAISEKSPRETTVRPISMMHNSTSVSAPSASFPPTMVAMPVLKSQSPPSSPPKAVVQSLPLATTTNAADTGAGRGVSGFYDNFYVEESSQRIF